MPGKWSSFGTAGEPDQDGLVRQALGVLDPAQERPLFWRSFQRAVLAAAGPELARRRRPVEPTVSDVVFAWSRALVPAAMLAAAAATAVFLRATPKPEEPLPMLLEEVIREGIDVPLAEDLDVQIDVSFASESF